MGAGDPLRRVADARREPLYGTAPPCPCGNAGCGGKAAGCGCNGSKMKCTCKPAAPRGAPVQCEPTVICEGYEFEVYRAPRAEHR